ncbi:ATPase, T2SS/T4P/T4SS family [Xanthobacter sp. DSM 14520]|uniref:ATPase, T2SS/T4P/T4SS family n=1 Tax=Xanthobacter autotrophicus (strain ATCC BAA-1158 / Py2) TaxID=78245 RepID=UPI003727EDEC
MPSWTGTDIGRRLGGQDGRSLGVGSKEEIRRLLIACAKLGASDIIFQSGQPVLAFIDGHLFSMTSHWLQPEDLRRVCVSLAANDSVMPRLLAGQPYDMAVQYEDLEERDANGDPHRYRFRVNITAMYYDGAVGQQLVLRYIRSEPPTPEAIALEPEIVAESAPSQGAVIIAGETGSGKTTTTAALKRNILAGNTHLTGNLITYEAPIEFLFADVPSACCTIAQHEVPLHVPSFADGVRNAMRRNPSLIEIQELRDAETITAAAEAANTGHTVYATTHASSVAHVFRRLPQRFPADQQVPGFFDVVSSTHLLVSQVLVPSVAGGRTCLREWQLITEDVRLEVERAGPSGAFERMRDIIARGEAGRPMSATVARKLEGGEITVETAIRALYRYGYRKEAERLSAPLVHAASVPAGGPDHAALTT